MPCNCRLNYSVKMWIDQKSADSLKLCSTSSLSSLTPCKQQNNATSWLLFNTKMLPWRAEGAFFGDNLKFWNPILLKFGLIWSSCSLLVLLKLSLILPPKAGFKLAVAVCDFRGTFYLQSKVKAGVFHIDVSQIPHLSYKPNYHF